MKRLSVILTVLALVCGMRTAYGEEYLYWQLDAAAAPDTVGFIYAQLAVEGDNVDKYFLTIGDTGSEVYLAANASGTSTTLAEIYSKLPADPSGLNFFVELYGESGLVGLSEKVSYASLAQSIYRDISITGVTTPYHFTAYAVPEPTSGLLVLLGLGALALRRRRRVLSASTGKRAVKPIIALAALVFTASAFGAANDLLLSFSTPGVDRYADGTRVLPGESYALVWTAQGDVFGGLTADCKPVKATDRLVLVAPLAQNGRCPVTVAEIAAADAPKYENGAFALYLLDTRVKGADGKTSLAKYVGGVPSLVNSLGVAVAGGAGGSPTDGATGELRSVAAVKLGEVGVYSEIAAPEIAAIEITGATIRLQVKGMSDAADYFVVPGVGPGGFAPALDAKVDKDGFTFEKPADSSVTFYKVIGVRKFGAAK